MDQKKEALDYIIGNKRIRTVFQPIISLRDGSVLGHEALSRITCESEIKNPDMLFAAAGEYNRLWEPCFYLTIHRISFLLFEGTGTGSSSNPAVTAPISIAVLSIKSRMSVLKTKGIKKLNNSRLAPNNTPPESNAFMALFCSLRYFPSHRTTAAITAPVNRVHNIAGVAAVLKDE